MHLPCRQSEVIATLQEGLEYTFIRPYAVLRPMTRDPLPPRQDNRLHLCQTKFFQPC